MDVGQNWKKKLNSQYSAQVNQLTGALLEKTVCIFGMIIVYLLKWNYTDCFNNNIKPICQKILQFLTNKRNLEYKLQLHIDVSI